MENFSEDNKDPQHMTAAQWLEEFKTRALAVKQAADEWAIRWNEPEGRFISAMLRQPKCLVSCYPPGKNEWRRSRCKAA